MKKTARRILAAIMVLAMMLACVPMASAATTPDDGGNYYEEYCDYDGVVRIPYGKITNLTFTKARGAKYFSFYTDNQKIVNIPDSDSSAMYGADDGATFVYVVQSDRDYNIIATSKYIVVVYDKIDADFTGAVTEIHVEDISMKTGETKDITCWVHLEGSVTYYVLTTNLTCNCVDTDNHTELTAYKKGTDRIHVYVVDTNCNVVETEINVTVRFSLLNWIIERFLAFFWWYTIG